MADEPTEPPLADPIEAHTEPPSKAPAADGR